MIVFIQNCNQLIQTIEETGTILREIRDLEEQVGRIQVFFPFIAFVRRFIDTVFFNHLFQIETENSNKTVANLERILEDYKAIRQENSVLAAKIKEGWRQLDQL